MAKKLYIKTFGCQMNEYDSDKIIAILKTTEDFQQIDNPDNADIIIFNTCSIREKAENKVYSDLGRVRDLKANNPDLIIGVGGCVASLSGENIVKKAPYVDLVFGPQTLHRLPELINKRKSSGKPQVDVSFPEIEKFDNLPKSEVSGVSAFVSIMEGCSKYCSYCVVPYTRGEEISRPVADILNEITDLCNHGVKEVNLLGQNVNAYRGMLPDSEIADFALLLELIHQIPNIERIRFTTSHPNEMSDRLINCYKFLPKLVSHLHLPVQSGSDKILAAMKRGYTALEYKSIIRKIKKIRMDMSFSSDFIVGFPNETEEDFEKTMTLIDDIKYDTSFSFIYSKRPGTPASDLEDSISLDVKLKRLQLLQKKIDENVKLINGNMINTVQKVLIESVSKKSSEELTGRTENFKVVNFVGNKRLIGQIVDVKITACRTNSLRGEIVINESL